MPTTSRLQEIPQSVPSALGIVSAVTTTKFVTVRFYDIQANHPGIRDREVLFRFDIQNFSAFSVGDAIEAGWTKNTPKDRATGAFKVQGKLGACFVRLVENIKQGSEADIRLREAARQVKGQVERKSRAPQNRRAMPASDRVLQVASSGDITSPVSTAQAVFGDLPIQDWLPVPVGLPQMTEEWFYDEHYVRIGYVSFVVDSPTEEIRVSEATPFNQINTLRSRSPIQKDNWQAVQQVTISVTFADNDAINRVLLPLIRLFDRAPFLPVFNKLLFEHNITAIALQSLSVSTIPGYPNAVRAQLVCLPFNWTSYLPAAREFTGLDALFCYPLLKIWVEQPRKGIPEYVPIHGRWDGQFAMRHPSEDWLAAVSEFPENSERARVYNEEIALANQIRLWRLNPTTRPEVFDGFTPTGPSDVRGNFDAEKGSTLILSQDVGRAIVDLTHFANSIPEREYAFIRIRSIENALKLAQHEDCVVILKNPVILRRGGVIQSIPFVDIPVSKGSKWIISGPDNRVDSLKRGDFLELLRQNDPPTRAALLNGQYIFVVHAHTRLVDRVADANFVTLPKDPGEPVVDDENVFDLSSLNIEVVSISKENTFAPHQVRGERTPTYQYLGSTPKYYQITGTIPESSNVNRIASFFERVNELSRLYKGKLDGTPFGGFVVVDNELFQLVGTKYVLPFSWSTSTIPNFPGVLRFEMTLVEFDATQRQREAIVDLMRGVELNEVKRKESLTDQPFIRYIRSKDLKTRLRAVELYPDLALPTYSELRKWLRDIKEDRVWDWSANGGRGEPNIGYEYLSPETGGTGWQWTIQVAEIQERKRKEAMLLPQDFHNLPDPLSPNRFASADFYCAPCQEFGPNFVDSVLSGVKSSQLVLHDTYGTTVDDYVPGTHLTEHNIRSENDPANTINKGKEAVGKVYPIGADSKLIDKINAGLVVPPGGAESVDNASSTLPFVTPVRGVAGRGSVSVEDGGSVEDRVQHYGPAASAAAIANGVPIDLFFALLEQENRWQMGPTSSKGAIGLGQLLPSTARELGVDPYDPASNLFGAAKYLAKQLSIFKDKDPQTREQLALAAYNSGAGNVKKHNGIPPFEETRNYVKSILRLRNKYLQQTTGQGTQFPISKPEFNYKRIQLLKYFNGGYGYNRSQIEKYIINPAAPSSIQFIKPEWIRVVLDRRVPISISQDLSPEAITIHGDIYVVIDNLHINAFLSATKAAGISLPLVKVPDRVEGKFLHESGIPTHPYHPPTISQAFHEPVGGRDMFYDLRRSYIQGRLIGAFPTFYVAIVDGGRSLRIWRLFDHVYGMFAITRIAVHRTRKGPVETALVGFSNMYGHLTAQAQQTSREQESDTRHIWNLPALWRGFQSYLNGIDNEMLAMWAKHTNTLLMKPGARLHIRLGYSSDANELPIVFNGVITEVPVEEGEIQVVALSDGIELTNDLPPDALQGSMPVTRRNASFGSGWHPRELVMSYLAPNSLLESISQLLGKTVSPIFYYNFRNEFGIEHFGQPIRFKLVGFDDGEVGINVYNPEFSTARNDSSAWDNHVRGLQVWKWDKNLGLVGINMHQATPWNIFDTVRKTIPDYILYTAPVELRSTLFLGKGWFPLFFEIKENVEDQFVTPQEVPVESIYNWKTFQQFHFISSDWNLINNQVRADATDVVTQVQAVGTYNGMLPGDRDLSNECSFLMMLDSDIYDEHQRRLVVESGLYTTPAMKLDEANSDAGGKIRVLISSIAAVVAVFAKSPSLAVAATLGLLEGPVRKFLLSRRINDHYAAMTLKDHVKEMYQGPLVILGNPFVKPYDYIGLVDSMSGLNGLAEAKEVTHTMSLETGYVTEVTPDCISNYFDYDGRDSLMWLATTLGHIASAVGMAHVVGRLYRNLSPYITLRVARRLRDFVRKDVAKAIDPIRGEPTLAPIANRFKAIVEQDIRDLENALRVRNNGAVQAIFRKFVTSDEYAEIYKSLPLDLKAQLRVQYVLRSIPGAVSNSREVAASIRSLGVSVKDFVRGVGELNEFTRTTRRQANKAVEFIRNQNSKLRDKLAPTPEKAVERFSKEVADAKTKLSQFNPRQVENVRQIIRSGGDISEINPAIVSAIRELDTAEKKLARSVARIAAAPGSRRLSNDLRRLVQGATSRTAVGIFLSGLFNMAIGGLSDYTIRWAVARQCLTVLPLRVWDKEFTAGINGHRGAVYGDPQVGVIDKWLETGMKLARGSFFGGLIPIIGDLAQENIEYRHEQIPSILPGDVSDNTRQE